MTTVIKPEEPTVKGVDLHGADVATASHPDLADMPISEVEDIAVQALQDVADMTAKQDDLSERILALAEKEAITEAVQARAISQNLTIDARELEVAEREQGVQDMLDGHVPVPPMPEAVANAIQKTPMATRMACGIDTASQGILDYVIKIYGEFRVAIIAVIAMMLYMTNTLLTDILSMKPENVSVEVMGIVMAFIAGVLATVKMFVTDRQSDSADRREHAQEVEMLKLKAKLGE